ncbi:3-oxoacyl-[acyl-carrier protein] reductase [Geomicrobium halophilum]|uniref:3-oxoacyl-[acyl-carrier protein] reductase n=1 Tax=Geomicrobium halophilum TaxID=549000 RepID=A0A841PVG0_9BACL|nr:3-ketoacyl-ACP reductase [Geomicrobium halophilum]MBB6451156.1 3-oxoacyl-[acyl-carrier protein] reductase [Geomicrobium halophilum]
MRSLSGKTALITGAGRGIGRAIAFALVNEGVNVGLVGKTHSNLEKVAEELKGSGVKVVAASADVSDGSSVKRAIHQVKENIGTIDILINNAGIGKFGGFLELTESDWQEVLNVNVMGVYHATQAVLPDMIEQQSGDIINISSTSGLRGSEGSSAYSASKFAVLGLSEALMKEVRKENVRVQALTPSKVITDFFGGGTEQSDEDVERFMQAEDLADVVVSQLKLHPRMFIKNAELWATNPK